MSRGAGWGRSLASVEPTSDETRVRPLWIAAALAAMTALAALVAGPDPRATGPIARPHARAGLACASCHDGASAAASCTGCHGEHRSARQGHAALAARGALGCVTCHPGHGMEGVTFAASGRFVRWGTAGERAGVSALAGPAGASVPLVAPAACARCHRADDPGDPVARCVREGVVTCFDEHRRVDAPPVQAGPVVCSAAHGVDRYVAWDAAREIALDRSPPRAASLAPALAPWGWSGAGLGAGALALAVLSRCTRRARPARAAPIAAARVRLPVIDAATCLGCSACVDACPFDVLAINRFVAIVARPSECCGVIACADACPNGSLRIADGEPIGDRPRVDAHLESLDAPGVFLAGDLTGLPLIRNAIEQGAKVSDRVGERCLARRHPTLDLLIVGAGPAGLSALLRARERGLRAACFEQSAFAASLRSFPRGKVVFDVPGALPLEGALWMREATKEELIAHWTRAVRKHALDVREHRRVVDVSRDADGFVVTAQADDGARETARAAHLLLAIGRRGTPRTIPLAVAPGAAGKVSYALADARSFAGTDVLVVGLGDTAMEAAIALTHAGARVTVSYRGADFTRGKARSRDELRSLVDRGRLTIRFGSSVEAVDARTATLSTGGVRERIPNDAVLVLIGGTPSWELVTRSGVRLARDAPPAGREPQIEPPARP